MTVQKIKSGRVPTLVADQFIGEHGTIFYNESLGDLRLSDGNTLGGIPLLLAGGGGALINIDGGLPGSNYGGIDAVDAGGIA